RVPATVTAGGLLQVARSGDLRIDDAGIRNGNARGWRGRAGWRCCRRWRRRRRRGRADVGDVDVSVARTTAVSEIGCPSDLRSVPRRGYARCVVVVREGASRAMMREVADFSGDRVGHHDLLLVRPPVGDTGPEGVVARFDGDKCPVLHRATRHTRVVNSIVPSYAEE